MSHDEIVEWYRGYAPDFAEAYERLEKFEYLPLTQAGFPDVPEEAYPYFGVAGVDHRLAALGPGWRISVVGITRVEDKDDKPEANVTTYHICDPFSVFGTGVDNRGDRAEDVLVISHRRDDTSPLKTTTTSIPRALIAKGGKELAAFLEARGFHVSVGTKERILLQRLLSALSGPKIVVAAKTGWIDDSFAFALPDGVIGGEADKRIHFDSADTRASKIKKRGTLTSWQEEIAAKAKGNSRLTLALCAGLTSPLLRFKSHDVSPMIHFYGQSSLGKSTALDVYGSCWGTSQTTLGYSQSWNATLNGLEGLCTMASDIGLGMDELRLAVDGGKGMDIVKSAYMIGNGGGRNAMDKNRTLRMSSSWRVLAVSSGEDAFSDLTRVQDSNNGKKQLAEPEGANVRIIDLPARASEKFGLFETVHRADEGKLTGNAATNAGKVFADGIKRASRDHCGHAGPALVEAIVKHTRVSAEREYPDADEHELTEFGDSAMKAQIQIAVDRFVKSLGLPEDTSQPVMRVAEAFGLIYTAGSLAVRYAIIPDTTREEIEDEIRTCFNAWLTNRGTAKSTAQIRPALSLRDWLQNNETRFVEIDVARQFNVQEFSDKRQRTTKLAGYKKNDFYYIIPAVWDSEIAGVAKEKTNLLTSWLAEKDYMLTGPVGRKQVKLRIPGETTQQRFYAISEIVRNLNNDGELDAEDANTHTEGTAKRQAANDEDEFNVVPLKQSRKASVRGSTLKEQPL